MAKLNPHYQQLSGSYIFPVIDQKMAQFQKKHPEVEVLNLGVGDVALPLVPQVAEAICQGVKEMTRETRGYGPSDGYPFLKEAICTAEYAKWGIGVDEIFISDGANTDASYIHELFDDESVVAVPDPCYPLYKNVTLLSGKKLLTLPLCEEEGFIPKPPQEQADLVYFCTPCNPTGVALNYAQLKDWVQWAKEHKALLIIDNVYSAFVSSDDIPPTVYAVEGAHEVAIEIRSFSKTAGFTGLRCGYMVIPKTLFLPSLRDLWAKRVDIKTNGVSYPIQKGAAACFKDGVSQALKGQVTIYQEAAKMLRETLTKLDQTFFGGIHAPYIWWKIPHGTGDWEFFDHLLHTAHILAIPGSGFGSLGKGFIRLSCFLSSQLAQKACHALRNQFGTN